MSESISKLLPLVAGLGSAAAAPFTGGASLAALPAAAGSAGAATEAAGTMADIGSYMSALGSASPAAAALAPAATQTASAITPTVGKSVWSWLTDPKNAALIGGGAEALGQIGGGLAAGKPRTPLSPPPPMDTSAVSSQPLPRLTSPAPPMGPVQTPSQLAASRGPLVGLGAGGGLAGGGLAGMDPQQLRRILQQLSMGG